MSEVVSAVLAKAAEEEALLGSTVVSKPIDPELDLGHMLAIDSNQTEFSEEKMPSEEELMELGRDCAQLLINSLWQLETERIEEAVVAHLPPPTFVLPRYHQDQHDPILTNIYFAGKSHVPNQSQ